MPFPGPDCTGHVSTVTGPEEREVVQPGRNRSVQRCLAETLDVVDATWCGAGVIPASGFALKPVLRRVMRVSSFPPAGIRRVSIAVRTGGLRLFTCSAGQDLSQQMQAVWSGLWPRSSGGSCMVSDEGACLIWWAGGTRERKTPELA